ncbi:ABC transporter ATP-binding protein [uncultured Azohydromonas sp.]|jgi:ABC-type nitrate/sulfonate/bicarbonate transport system, ATPase component|uniref:ABC transporter ATP-binding protein n=1 Tax=uncultured Azohydromonas sp. TaxID=487342 RepID=UPI002616C107|nr:ABC transporter ATP-binding protein [uncultured Azohydromonas sp.]
MTISGRPAAAPQAGNSGEIVVQGVGKDYGAGAFSKCVMRNCSFTIESGKLTVMIGPSGCGKSTLIRLLAGFERPTVGEIRIDGEIVTAPGKDRLVVFQESALFPWMTSMDNILYGPRARGEMGPNTREHAGFLLKKVGLEAFRDKYPSQLSGGMQRRAELARAMINNPKVMILDEPFRGLDAMSKELMWEYYAALFEESHRTNFFITTDIDEAIYLADRLIVMTNIPMRVRTVIDLELPRPRRLADIFDNEHANDVKMTVLSLLHEEAMKSFSGGSKAASDFVEAYARRTGKGATA